MTKKTLLLRMRAATAQAMTRIQAVDRDKRPIFTYVPGNEMCAMCGAPRRAPCIKPSGEPRAPHLERRRQARAAALAAYQQKRSAR
jgi:hypothetical protein